MLGVEGSSRESAGLVPAAKQVSKFSPCFDLHLDVILGSMFLSCWFEGSFVHDEKCMPHMHDYGV